MKEQRIPTPEELRWTNSVFDPEKAKRNLKFLYILSGIWAAMILGWSAILILEEFDTSDWWSVIALVLSGASLVLGIVNNKRILKGKKPFGDI